MRRTWLALGLVLCWTTVVVAQVPTADEAKATVTYLRSFQNRDGGFSPSRSSNGEKAVSSLRATSAALRALKYFGGEPRDVRACREFVTHCFNKNLGGFADTTDTHVTDVATTSIGLMALVELKLPVADYRGGAVKYLAEHTRGFEQIRIAAAGLEAMGERPPQADDWLKELDQLRNPDGTFGKGPDAARMTGGAVVAVLRLGGKVENRAAVVRTLVEGQRPDGAWGKAGAAGSDLESSYRVMRAFHMLHDKPDVGRCRQFVARCRNADGGYGVAPGQPSTVGATYYAAIILHWLDSK